jgi:hypothetical protein
MKRLLLASTNALPFVEMGKAGFVIGGGYSILGRIVKVFFKTFFAFFPGGFAANAAGLQGVGCRVF